MLVDRTSHMIDVNYMFIRNLLWVNSSIAIPHECRPAQIIIMEERYVRSQDINNTIRFVQSIMFVDTFLYLSNPNIESI